MPIEIRCPQCRRKFRVPEKYAGKHVKCPKCEGTIGVPAEGKPAPEAPGREEKTGPKQAGPDRPAADRWYLQTEDGHQFGPASRKELDDWFAEGRIDASCQLLREGWKQWKWADEVFPELAEANTQTQPAAVAAEENPFVGIGEAVRPSQEKVGSSVSPQGVPGGIDVGVGSGGEGGEITPGMRQALAQTRPWLMFMSILGFIGAGLGGIGSLIYAVISLGAVSLLGPIGIVFLTGALMMAGATVLYVFAAYYLFSCASAIARFLRSRESRDLERALVAQKSFWKLVGMVTAAVIALGLALVVLFMALGGVASTMG